MQQTRRLLLRRGAVLAGAGVLASLLEACTAPPTVPTTARNAAATKLVMLDAANIDAPDMAARKQVLTDFMAKNPDVTIDWPRARRNSRKYKSTACQRPSRYQAPGPMCPPPA